MKKILISGTLIFLCSSIFAQDIQQQQLNEDTTGTSVLEEVIVTAQKKEERLLRVPLAVSAITSRQVREYRLWNLEDISAIVPNLYTANPGDNRNVTSIRGITTTSYDPAVITYVDGVSQFNLDTYIPQLLDVERIEILRGPQGTLYGRNAMGGVVHVITKAPINKTRVFGEVSFGNYGQQQYNAGFSTAVVPGKLFAGVALQYQGRDGFYTNTYNGEDFDGQYIFSGNYYLIFRPSSTWKLGLNVKHQSHRNNGAFPLAPDKTTAFEEPFRLNQNALATMQDNGLNASFSAQYRGKKMEMQWQTAYQSNYRIYDGPLDGDFSPMDIVSIFNDYGNNFNKVQVWTQEIRFSSLPDEQKKLSWTAGTYLFTQHNPVKQATVFGADAPLIGLPDANFSLIGTNTGKNQGLAFFGQLQYKISSTIQLTAGLRYDYEHRSLQILGEYLKDPLPPFVTRPDTSANKNFQALLPKVSLSFTPTEKQTYYLQFSRGYRAGGFTPLSSDPSQPPLFAYDPEFSNNIELGAKLQAWKNKLRLNAALFYTRVTDAQVPTLVLPDAVTVIRNAGSLISKGLEWEMTLLPFKGFELQYNAGFVQATYKTLRLSQNGQEQNFDGNWQVFTPSSTSLLAAQYGFPIGLDKKFRLTLRGEWARIGDQYFDLSNAIHQEAYSLFNIRAGVNFAQYGLYMWIRNLTDQNYIAYAYDFGGVHLGNPKTYGVTISARF